MSTTHPHWKDNTTGAARVAKQLILRVPGIRVVARYVAQRLRDACVTGTAAYWESRYRRGDGSGAGSYGALAQFKADVINGFVARNGVQTVIELGCGDAAQLALATYPSYTGVDVSPTAVASCRRQMEGDQTKRFFALADAAGYRGTYDLALSLDVVYHLLEDPVFTAHMQALFSLAGRYVIIYSSNYDARGHAGHIRHHSVTDWVAAHAPEWQQIDFIRNPYPYDRKRPAETSFADFYHFGRR
jgi:cyclopropane fatty-acyl-phospholipid synthase-like methyltransferase